MSYSPDTGLFYVPGTIRTSAFARYGDQYKKGKQYNGGTQAAPIGSADERQLDRDRRQYQQDCLAEGCAVPRGRWRRIDRRRPAASCCTAIPAGQSVPLNAKTGEVLWQFQTGFGAEATPMVYEVDGQQYIAIAAGGNQGARQRQRRCRVDLLVEGQVEPVVAAAAAADRGRTRADRLPRMSTRSRSATTTSSSATFRRARG